MGALDEAIREHLELKRKHGASPEDVTRQENEALGPARREAPAEETDASPEAEPVPEEPVEIPQDVAATRVMEQPAVAEPDPQPTVEPEPEPEAEPQPDPETPSGDTPPRGAPAVEDENASGEEADAEDVLEDTPDFLQETPEHDRLWFEQKPPRDFDFD